MSYPRKVHILIIEDEQEPIESYLQLLAQFQSRFPSVEPVIACSYDDAMRALQSPHVFHVVLLDLNLPLATRSAPPNDIAPGEQLLELLAQRDSYPIPAVLVVSGKLGLARLSDLHDRLKRDFWYGSMVNKGLHVKDELERALERAHQYCDVGVHVREGERSVFPAFTPREEDLLRRCVLAQTPCLGLDVTGWSVDHYPSTLRPSPRDAPTKVFMGRFLLDDGMGLSRPTFFKFETAANAPYACRDVDILTQKLSHVKVLYALASRNRNLLVTQSVTNGTPVSLEEYLNGEPSAVEQAIPSLAGDIVQQLDQLETPTERQLPAHELLWGWHDRDAIASALTRHGCRDEADPPAVTPLTLFEHLQQARILLWAGKRGCTHGDLNATNVAVDPEAPGRPQAFIFDAGGIRSDVDVRDLAVLEVTTLLFDDSRTPDAHFHAYEVLYQGALVPAGPRPSSGLPFSVVNRLRFISAIRGSLQTETQSFLYPLMLFDAVMAQVGGLAIQPTGNKISCPANACRLARWAAAWLIRLAPQLAPPAAPPPTVVSPPTSDAPQQ